MSLQESFCCIFFRVIFLGSSTVLDFDLLGISTYEIIVFRIVFEGIWAQKEALKN